MKCSSHEILLAVMTAAQILELEQDCHVVIDQVDMRTDFVLIMNSVSK